MSVLSHAHQAAKSRPRCTYSHRWQALFEVGAFLCTDCGLKAYCPDCRSLLPSHVAITYCVKHKEKERQA